MDTKASDRLTTHLKTAGHRITRSRIAVWNALVSLRKPSPIEVIHQAVSGHTVDLVTIYRNLHLFEEIGMAARSFRYNGTILFQAIPEDGEHQHWIACRHCGAVQELPFCPAEGLTRWVHAQGFREVRHVVGYFGLCRNCVP